MELKQIVEALLIASEAPLSCDEIARLIRVAASDKSEETSTGNAGGNRTTASELQNVVSEQIESSISALLTEYYETSRAFTILERAHGWKIYTKPEFSDYVKELFPSNKPQRLSGPAMETLAIIAYRQPITKAAMEAVRGVSCDGMIQKLLDRELISIGGRADLPGRPLLYQTTERFFEHFGIKSIAELPNSGELRSIALPEASEKASSESDDKKPEQASLDSSVISPDPADSSKDPHLNL